MNFNNFGVLICQNFNIICIEKKIDCKLELSIQIFIRKKHIIFAIFFVFCFGIFFPEMVKLSVFGFLVTECRKKKFGFDISPYR